MSDQETQSRAINKDSQSGMLLKPVSSLCRALVILSSNNSKVLSFVLPFALVLSCYVALSTPMHGLGLVAAISIAVLVGFLLACTNFERFVKRAIRFLNCDEQKEQAPSQTTGLIVLDQFIGFYRHRVQHLLETVATVGEEAESIIERYEILTENLAAAVIIRDEVGKITYCSPFTEVLTGYALSEIYESEEDFISKIVHSDDIEKFKRALAVSSCGEAFQFRYRFYHKSGIEMWAETRTVPVMAEDGSVRSSLSIMLDVTGTVRYQKQVEEKNKDLKDFTYMISHDLKAPIFTIKGMAKMLELDCKENLDEESQETLDHIVKAADRLSNLVSRVVEYSKATNQQGTLESVSCTKIFDSILADYSPQIKEAQAEIELDPTLPNVLGDHIKIYQIVSNLVGNALKYRDKNRKLKLEVKVEPSGKQKMTLISFRDNGLGIPEDKLDSIFRPFQRAHGAEIEGSGIGLACVKKIVDYLGGEIHVESTPNVGSTFYLSLPRQI